MQQSDLRRCAYAKAKEIGLDQQDRISLSNLVTGYDHDSWNHLSDTQLGRVLDAMRGWEAINYLLTHDDHGRVYVD